MTNKPYSEEVLRLAGALGVDPDDPLVRILQPQARLERKIDQWTETNLELLRLLTARTQETERMSQIYEQLGNTYANLSTQLNGLQIQIQELNIRSQQFVSDTRTMNALEVQSINAQLKSVHTSLSAIAQLDLERRDWTWSVNAAASWLSLLVLLFMSLWVLPRPLNHLRGLVNSALIRLERVEKALGTVE